MKRCYALILILCLVLCGCAQTAPSGTTTSPVIDTTAPPQSNVPDTTAVPVSQSDTTVAEPDVQLTRYRNPLNGQPINTPWTSRPFAIMINNIEYAQPLCSVGSADFLFEILAEGGVTRCLAVYSDISGLEHIGSLRSARPYYADIANSFGAIFVHHGGTDDGYAMIRELDLDDIDADSDAFYRDQLRLDSGYDLEHTSFTHGASLLEAASRMDYSSAVSVDCGFQFGDTPSTEDGESADTISVTFGGYNKNTTLHFDVATDVYHASQYGSEVIDGNTDTAVDFRNVLVLRASTSTYAYGSKTVLDVTLTGTGEGYFACDGKLVPILWSRESHSTPFVFTHTDGTPITFGVGATYAAVVPTSSDITWQ